LRIFLFFSRPRCNNFAGGREGGMKCGRNFKHGFLNKTHFLVNSREKIEKKTMNRDRNKPKYAIYLLIGELLSSDR